MHFNKSKRGCGKLGAPLSKRAYFQAEVGVPFCARKVNAATQARKKRWKSCNAHKGASQGLHAEASLTLAEMNQALEEP